MFAIIKEKKGKKTSWGWLNCPKRKIDATYINEKLRAKASKTLHIFTSYFLFFVQERIDKIRWWYEGFLNGACGDPTHEICLGTRLIIGS